MPYWIGWTEERSYCFLSLGLQVRETQQHFLSVHRRSDTSPEVPMHRGCVGKTMVFKEPKDDILIIFIIMSNTSLLFSQKGI